MSLVFIEPAAQALYGVLARYTAAADLIFLFLVAFMCFNMFALYAIFGGYLERKTIARIHSRIGPMYTGPAGALQTVADAVKFLRKEVIFPRGSDTVLFRLAPVLFLVMPFVAVVFVPIGSFTIVHSDYSLLIALALLSLSPIAVLLGSWASNSTYSTLGGLRSAGMTMSYEVLLALSAASLALTAHTLSIEGIVAYQATHGIWFALLQPLAFVLFIIGLIASVERNPFDLLEAESELVGGWKTEYGGVYFSLTLLAEYIKLLVSIFLFLSLFFGGSTGVLGDVGFIALVIVCTLFMFAIRATAMRLRLDQIFANVWNKFVPLALVNLIVTMGILAMLGGV